VKYILGQIPPEFVMKQAGKLRKYIENALPTRPQITEESCALGFIDEYTSSPEHNLQNISDDDDER